MAEPWGSSNCMKTPWQDRGNPPGNRPRRREFVNSLPEARRLDPARSVSSGSLPLPG